MAVLGRRLPASLKTLHNVSLNKVIDAGQGRTPQVGWWTASSRAAVDASQMLERVPASPFTLQPCQMVLLTDHLRGWLDRSH